MTADRPPHPAGPDSRPVSRPRPSGHVVTDAGELLTQADVERRIMKLSDELDELTHALDQQARAAGEAEGDYKVAFHAARVTARAILDGNGPGGRVTNDEAEDFAMEKSEDEFRTYKVAEAVYQSGRDALRAKMSQLDALRTIAANIRAQT